MSLPVTYNQTIVGTCSVCSGPVCVPTAYHSIVPPTPKCHNCGATAKPNYGPVVPMNPPVVDTVKTWPSTEVKVTAEKWKEIQEKIEAALTQGRRDGMAFKWPNEVHVDGIERRYVCKQAWLENECLW